MRFRLQSTLSQEAALLEHCAHARFVWNLAVEQHQHWRSGRESPPSYAEQSRQLTEVGWVRFRWSRIIPSQVKSVRINRDRVGRWHIAIAVIPPPVHGPSDGGIVGVDPGVIVSAALSTGQLLSVPGLRETESERLLRLQRRLARAKLGSARRRTVKAAIARLQARQVDRRKDWVEKTSTDLARRFGRIRVEDLKVRNMVRSARGTLQEPGRNVRAKAGLNRAIHAAGWGLLVTRLEDKAPGRVERVDPAYTSQICHACGHRAAESRESRAVYRCCACGHTDHADVNAAKNIAAGRAVTARGGRPLGGPVNREPQLVPSSA